MRCGPAAPALDMVKRVDELNAERRKEVEQNPDEPYHEIKIGIGINSGQCVVGNMGSDMRFDYTALGDTVNLASRLEGQSKPYGISVILGDNTAMAVADTLAVVEIDLIRVKGKNEPERIHALLGVEEMVANDDFPSVAGGQPGHARQLQVAGLAGRVGQRWTGWSRLPSGSASS